MGYLILVCLKCHTNRYVINGKRLLSNFSKLQKVDDLIKI